MQRNSLPPERACGQAPEGQVTSRHSMRTHAHVVGSVVIVRVWRCHRGGRKGPCSAWIDPGYLSSTTASDAPSVACWFDEVSAIMYNKAAFATSPLLGNGRVPQLGMRDNFQQGGNTTRRDPGGTDEDGT